MIALVIALIATVLFLGAILWTSARAGGSGGFSSDGQTSNQGNGGGVSAPPSPTQTPTTVDLP